MILLDTLYINNSGGKVLLDFLVNRFEEKQVNVFYLFDMRVDGEYNFIPECRRLYLNATLLNRLIFYMKNAGRFTKILCFANIPPPIKVNAQCFTYFHQNLYLEKNIEYKGVTKLLIGVKSEYIRMLKNNTNFWVVQSPSMKYSLCNKFNLLEHVVKIIPFFQPLSTSNLPIEKLSNSYLYISDGNLHKNHVRLFAAFKRFSQVYGNVQLHVTISESYPNIIDVISNFQKDGVSIVNHGKVPFSEISKLYQSSKFSVYPSISESFGLGLIEAISMGCMVIGADLPYLHSVCRPTLVFDPFDENSILDALIRSQNEELRPSSLKVQNEVEQLIDLLVH